MAIVILLMLNNVRSKPLEPEELIEEEFFDIVNLEDSSHNNTPVEFIQSDFVTSSSYNDVDMPTMKSSNGYHTLIQHHHSENITLSADDLCNPVKEIIRKALGFIIVKAREEYKLLRRNLVNVTLFDECFERACMFSKTELIDSESDRSGKFVTINFSLDTDKEESKDSWHSSFIKEKDKDKEDHHANQSWDDNRDFCRKNQFCRHCPFRSSCCDNWCRKTCYDEDFNQPDYCKRWRKSNLCKKVNYCRCNWEHGDCYDASKNKGSSRSFDDDERDDIGEFFGSNSFRSRNRNRRWK